MGPSRRPGHLAVFKSGGRDALVAERNLERRRCFSLNTLEKNINDRVAGSGMFGLSPKEKLGSAWLRVLTRLHEFNGTPAKCSDLAIALGHLIDLYNHKEFLAGRERLRLLTEALGDFKVRLSQRQCATRDEAEKVLYDIVRRHLDLDLTRLRAAAIGRDLAKMLGSETV
jgi:hypothetical protein